MVLDEMLQGAIQINRSKNLIWTSLMALRQLLAEIWESIPSGLKGPMIFIVYVRAEQATEKLGPGRKTYLRG